MGRAPIGKMDGERGGLVSSARKRFLRHIHSPSVNRARFAGRLYRSSLKCTPARNLYTERGYGPCHERVLSAMFFVYQ